MKIYDTRDDMIADLVPKHGTYAEVGVLAGDFSKTLHTLLEPNNLVLIDMFQGICPSGDRDGNNLRDYDLDICYKELYQLAESESLHLTIEKGDSSTILKRYMSHSFDMVYIDGDHSYEGCKRDLDVAFQKVRPGGWICGHDYEMNMEKARTSYDFGVKRAVDEFCAEHGLSIHAKAMDGCVSFAIQKPHSKNLVYYTLGFSDTFIPLLEMSITSLRKSTPSVDIVILCDESLLAKCSYIQDVTFYPMKDTTKPEYASMQKLRIFEYPLLPVYDCICYIDSDILVYHNMNTLLAKCQDDSKLYVCSEGTNQEGHHHLFYSLETYTEEDYAMLERENIFVFNAGLFAFHPSPCMKEHFQGVLSMIHAYILAENTRYFYEQSFLNVYFNLRGSSATNRTVFTPENYIMHQTVTRPIPNTLIHFCGDPGNAAVKLDKMKRVFETPLTKG